MQNLTLGKTLDICRAAEILQKQLKEVKDLQGEQVNSLRHCKPTHLRNRKTKQSQQTDPRKPPTTTGTRGTGNKHSECKYCGCLHEFKKEICPAYGKTCSKCRKKATFLQSVCKINDFTSLKEVSLNKLTRKLIMAVKYSK